MDKRFFNGALGKTLIDRDDLPDTGRKAVRIRVALAIALAAAGLILTTNMWIGN